MNKKYTLLALIVVVAAVLRLWKLDEVPVSLFGDELDVGYHAYSLGLTGSDYSGNFLPLQLRSIAEWRTPLYIYSAIPTVLLFGINAWGVRLPAALFGILGVIAIYFLAKKISGQEKIGLFAAFILAISPWHIQYSRAGFEVTQMLFFMIMGLYVFLSSIKHKGKWLWLSVLCFMLMPWIYNTGKLFVPLLLAMLAAIYRKELLSLPRKSLVLSMAVGVVLGIPLVLNIIAGEGSQRFGYLSAFDSQEAETHVGAIRGLDASFEERVFHNKYTFWGNRVMDNYFTSFSSDFLFNSGDPNPRHSIDGMGVLYRPEAVPLLIGIAVFFGSRVSRKVKLLIAGIVLGGALPAAITRDGGTHATRLIIMLPAFTLLIAYGLSRLSRPLLALYIILITICFFFFQHNYWNENTRNSESWWHAGWGEAIQSIKAVDQEYDRVFISMKGEPAYIFFAAHYAYDPAQWQLIDPVNNKIDVKDVGEVSYIDKYYFADLGGSLYDWGNSMTPKDLYLVPASVVHVNVYAEPERLPSNLKLVDSIPYPSENPAFYIFTGVDEE